MLFIMQKKKKKRIENNKDPKHFVWGRTTWCWSIQSDPSSESSKTNTAKAVLMQPQTCDTRRKLSGLAASFLPKHILFPLVGLHLHTHSKLSISLLLPKEKKKSFQKLCGAVKMWSKRSGESSLFVHTELLTAYQRSFNSRSTLDAIHIHLNIN